MLATVYVRNEIKRKQKRQLSKQITTVELRQFGGSDRKLDRCEFALAKLVAQGKISHKEIAECYKQFKAMDVDHSGKHLPTPPHIYYYTLYRVTGVDVTRWLVTVWMIQV